MTAPAVDPFEPITALLRQDFESYERLRRRADSRRFVAAFTAAFAVAADWAFGHGQGASDIVRFVDGVRARLDDDGRTIDADKAERILRTIALGEEGLLEDVDERALGEIEALLLLPLLDDAEGWDDARIDRFLADARTLVSTWAAR